MRNSKRSEVDAFIVMDVLEAARAAEEKGRKIIHMEIGQPGTAAPAGARKALARALDQDALGYTVARGLPALRRKIAERYSQWYDLDLDPERVVVTAGASGAFVLAFSALFDAGDRVGLSEPGYPSYRQIMRAMSLTPVGIPARPEDRYQPVPEQLTPDLAGMIVASPGNPSGTILSKDRLAGLIARADENDTAFISDEIYHGLSYDEPCVSALSISDRVYIINSFSKYFSMTGWRIGWMVVPPDHVRRLERLAQNLFICAPHASQMAALAAMDCDQELLENVQVYARNRDIVAAGLTEAGLTGYAPPDGAFYFYVDVSHLTDDALGLSHKLLEKAGIAVTPGLDFDPKRGHHFLRFSYAGSTEDMAEGMARLVAFMKAGG